MTGPAAAARIEQRPSRSGGVTYDLSVRPPLLPFSAMMLESESGMRLHRPFAYPRPVSNPPYTAQHL